MCKRVFDLVGVGKDLSRTTCLGEKSASVFLSVVSILQFP